jgi:hypothetical protein
VFQAATEVAFVCGSPVREIVDLNFRTGSYRARHVKKHSFAAHDLAEHKRASPMPLMNFRAALSTLKRFKAANLRRADPIQFDARPSFVHRWFTAHSQRLSAIGKRRIRPLRRQALPVTATITPGWERDWGHFTTYAETTAVVWG